MMNHFIFNWISHYGSFKVSYRLKENNCRIVISKEAPPVVPETHLMLFERAISCSLPEDYREFIRVYSDAYVLGGVTGNHSPGEFYGLRTNSGTSLIAEWAYSRNWLPAFTIPVAFDVGNGGTICLNLAGVERGTMTWYCIDASPEPIAPSFASFVSDLRLRED